MVQERIFDPSKEELKKLYQNYTMHEIGAMYGVNAETVRKRVHEHGIAARKTGPSRNFRPPKEELASLYQTMSMAQIAEHYGVGETIVFKRIKEHGITLHGFENGGHRKKTGKVFTKEHRENLSIAQAARSASGYRPPSWKGGVTEENLRLRRTGAYVRWKKDSLERAGNKCEMCGVANGTVCECCGTRIVLHAHHIKPFATFPEGRFDPQNSEVLCPKCHGIRHNRIIG